MNFGKLRRYFITQSKTLAAAFLDTLSFWFLPSKAEKNNETSTRGSQLSIFIQSPLNSYKGRNINFTTELGPETLLQNKIFILLSSTLTLAASSILLSLALPLKAVGIEDDNKIDDGKLTSSSSTVGHEAWRGRLHGQGSWKPEKADPAPNFNITLDSPELSPVNVTYIATQGSPTKDCWVTTFTIHYKMNGGSLKQYPEVCIMVTGQRFVT